MNFIDFKKYKRFFTFGCSFTNHTYPTWANVMASEMPDAEFYNFGLTGAGNVLINSRIAEADLKFNFCETDLIMVMYSTYYREDRWINGSWMHRGNVYNNDFYDTHFIKKYVDQVGCLIRDFSSIYTTYNFVKSLPCDSYFMLSSDWEQDLKSEFLEETQRTQMLKVVSLYESFFNDNFHTPLFHSDIHQCSYGTVDYINHENKECKDPHPTALVYRDYLNSQIELTENSEKYVAEAMIKLKSCKYSRDFKIYFPEVDNQISMGWSPNILL